jgi:hypothetical protein
MTTYFESTNENGANVQINDVNYIYSYSYKGTFANIYTGYNIRQAICPYSTGTSENGQFYYYRLNLDGSNQIVYVYNPSSTNLHIIANNTVYGGIYGGNNEKSFNGSFQRTVRCIIFGVFTSDKSLADNLQYIVFKKATKTTGNIGLNVFDSSGSLVFSSNDKNLIVRKASFCVNGANVSFDNNVRYNTSTNTFDSYENTFSYPIGANFDVGMGVYSTERFGEGNYHGNAIQLCTLSKNHVKIEPSKYYAGDYSNVTPYDVEVLELSRNYSIYSICDLTGIV